MAFLNALSIDFKFGDIMSWVNFWMVSNITLFLQ